MAKFYIQSGDVRFTVSAQDAEGAALWVVNVIIGKYVPTDLPCEQLLDRQHIGLLLQAMDLFDPEIRISEIGFGRDEVAVLDTELMFKNWFELANAMNHLFDQL